jgi:hypothetical protein
MKTEMFKTVLCRQWESGSCKFGARCHFAHGKSDICEKRAPSNAQASAAQSRPDTHSRSLCESHRGKRKVGDSVSSSNHQSSQQHSETFIGEPKSDVESDDSGQTQSAMPKGKTDHRRVTFMDNGVVYIHDSTNPEADSKEEVFPTTAAVRAKEQRAEKEKLWADAGDRTAIKESRKRKP